MRLTIYGCDAEITHGDFAVLNASDSAYDLSPSACSQVPGIRYDTAFLAALAVSDSAACCSSCGTTAGCFSWSYSTNGSCALRSAPLNGVGVSDSTSTSGGRPPAQGRVTCDLGWTGRLCEKRDLYKPSTGLIIPAYTRTNFLETSPTDTYALDGDARLNADCAGGEVLTHNPSVTAGVGGALDRTACEIMCTDEPRCVAFSWRSNFECYTYSTCDNPSPITGRGLWIGYLYLKLSLSERLSRFNSTAWQPFTVGNSLLFGEGSSHSSAINSSGPVSPHFAVDGQRVHQNVSSGLWYNPNPFGTEDFIEIPINATTRDAQISSVTIWNYCVSPGTNYDNEGASVSLRLTNGSYFYCGAVGQVHPCTFYTVACSPGVGVFATAVRISTSDPESRLAVTEIEAFEIDSTACEATYYRGDRSGLVADRTAANACPAVTQFGGCTSTDLGCKCGKQKKCSASNGCPCQGEACIDGICEAAWISTEACQVPTNEAGIPQASLMRTIFQYFNDYAEGNFPPLLVAEEVSFAMAECAANCTFRCCQLEVNYVSPGTLTRQHLRCSGANVTGTVYSTTTSVLYRPHKLGQPNGYSPCFTDSECQSGYCDKVTDPRPGQGACAPAPSWASSTVSQGNVISNGDIRLVDGPTQYAGRVEIWIETVTAPPSSTAPPPPPQWYTVCDDYWTSHDAEVVCRRAGFQAKGAIAYKRARFGEGTVPIGLDNLACVGNETSLLDCARFGGLRIYQHNCQHADDAGVQCVDPDQPSTDSFIISLKNGTEDTTALGFGRVEILAPLLNVTGVKAMDKAHWVNQTVCDDGFTDADAAVVCRSLGMLGGMAVPNIVYDGATIVNFYGGPGHDNQTIMLDGLSCEGTESWLLNCSHNGRQVTDCQHWEDAAVVCINTTETFSPTVAIAGATTPAPSFSPTFLGAAGNFSCSSTLSSLPAATSGCELGWDDSDVVWRENRNSGFGAGTYDPLYNSNPGRHLSFPLKTSVNYSAGYWVRIEWDSQTSNSSTVCDHVTFYVPAGSNIFSDSTDKHIVVSNVSYSAAGGSMSQIFGSAGLQSAYFCHACTGPTSAYRPGETCWALTPASDNNRTCGCNGHGSAGSGIYYGGFANGTQTQCEGMSGGFAGPKLEGTQKGGFGSVGLRLSVQQTCTSESPTTIPTAAPTQSLAPTTASPTPFPCARAYSQCGGLNWAGATTCVQDHYCQIINPLLSRCTPSYPAGATGHMWSGCAHDSHCLGRMYCDDWDSWTNVTRVYYSSRRSPTFTCQPIPICPPNGVVAVSAPTAAPTSSSPSLAPTSTSPTAPTAATTAPTSYPTSNPTSLTPTNPPTAMPTHVPTHSPTLGPTNQPTLLPSTQAPTSAAPSSSPTTIAPSSASPTVQPSISRCQGHPADNPACLQFLNDCNDAAVRIVCPITCNACSSAPTMASFTYSPTSPTAAPTIPNVTSAPTFVPTRFPTREPTEQPSDTPTDVPSESPTSLPTNVPTPQPSNGPTVTPTSLPTNNPTGHPTGTPTTNSPTGTPSTKNPTLPNSPSARPTPSPSSGRPTPGPTTPPTESPSELPTGAPAVTTLSTTTVTSITSSTLSRTTVTVSSATTVTSTTSTTTSTTTQSDAPTTTPSALPSHAPSAVPSSAPTASTASPSDTPTVAPSEIPTNSPSTQSPTQQPSALPTISPTSGTNTSAPTFARRERRQAGSTITTSTITTSTRTSTVTSTSTRSSTVTTLTTVTSITSSTVTATTATTQPCDIWFGNVLNGAFGNCTIGQYLDESSVGSGSTAICQDCLTGTYMDEEVHQHTQCKAYDAQLCSPGYFLVEDRSISSDRLCAPCGGNDGSSSSLSDFQSELGFTGTSCTPVSKCGKGQYAANVPTDSRDRECLPCAAGTYQPNTNFVDSACLSCPSGSFSGEGASSCTAHSTCTGDEYTVSAGTAVSDAVCISCLQGQYFVEGGSVLDTFSSQGQDTSCGGTGAVFNDDSGTLWPFNHTTSGDFEDCLQICSANENCTAYEEVQSELLCLFYGHSTIATISEVNRHCFVRDIAHTSCQPCEQNTYMPTTKHVNTSCIPVTQCTVGQFLVDSAWPDTDAICASCPSNLYQDAQNHSFRTCKSPTVCQSLGLEVQLAATPSSDTLCLTSAASSGVGGDAASSTSFAVLMLLIILTCLILYLLHRRYGGGKVAKARREARERKIKEAKTEEGREPDDDSECDDSDDEDVMIAGGLFTGTGGDVTKLPTVHRQKSTYQDGVVEPKHIEGSRVTFLDKLGEGAFGAVYLGFYDSPDDASNNIGGAYNVAVKVLKQGALTKKQLQMMTRQEVVAALQNLDDENVPKPQYSEGISAGSPYDKSREGLINVSQNPPKPYSRMAREELIDELLERQTLAHARLKTTALTRGQLADESQWTLEDIKGELVNMDRDLSDARYRGLDHEELVNTALKRQAEGLILDGNEFARLHLTRMHKDQLIGLIDRFDAKKLRLHSYEMMDQKQLIEAYLQRDDATMDAAGLAKLEPDDIVDCLLEMDENAGDDDVGDGYIGAAPLTGMYDRLHKDDLIEAVLTRQQEIADAEHESKMKEA